VSLVGLDRAPEVVPAEALTMFAVVVVGSLIGLLLPFVFARFGN
jgi:magnesium transporter